MKLDAGRELDALIAEKVMGWTWDESTAWSPSGGRNSRTGRPDDPWWWLPHYSTDIAAAWEVFEKIPMTIYAPHASLAAGEYENVDQWVAEARLPSKESISESADTAPLAICLAALKALGSSEYDEIV